MKVRCAWCGESELYQQYHDTEWGMPEHDDRKLFEMLILEGAQAGLSWITVLKKRENYRKAFDNFEVEKIAQYDEKKVQSLLQNKGIIRNKLKIKSAIQNARIFLKIQKEFGSFDKYIWKFVDFKPIKNSFSDTSEIPASTPLSDAISKDLKKRGMNFVGSTIIYAYLQAIGVVNDHTTDCFCYSRDF
jgi:DNA-3-methyladenine glycosylase I